MSFFEKLLGGGTAVEEPCAATQEHSLLVHLAPFGSGITEREGRVRFRRLLDAAEEAVVGAGIGEYDGEDYVGEHCTLFFRGADADALQAAVEPVLARFADGMNGVLVRRYGPPEGQG